MADNTRSHPRSAPPISRHPLFPAVVALWFAALFGFGAIAIRLSSLESWVVALGIDGLIPAAAPPLGVTAQLCFVLVCVALGGATGWSLASRPTRDRLDPFDSSAAEHHATLQSAAWPRAVLEEAGAEPFPTVAAPEEDVEAAPSTIELPAPPEAEKPRTAAQRIASAELEELSHVELVERLAIAIDRRRSRLESPPARATVMDGEPVFAFPGQAARRAQTTVAAAHDLEQTEQALRQALEKLQRMSAGG